MPFATCSSQYLTMRDGTLIAIDLWLPKRSQTPCPTIVRQTSYFRSLRLRSWLAWVTSGRPLDPSRIYSAMRKKFLGAGYAWVDVDVRGTGASSGFRAAPWSQPEVADAHEVVKWIVKQPWCNGNLGSLGVSYDGTASEMLLTTGHPAIKAIAPLFSCHDAYADIGFPGGIPNVGFTTRWGALNRALERNRLQDIVGAWVMPLTSGVSAVDADQGERKRDQAIAEHVKNYDVLQRMSEITFIDDDPPIADVPRTEVLADDGTPLRGIQLVSPSCYLRELRATGVPIFSVSGWWDGAYARAAALRFHSIPNAGSRLLLGPWSHGGHFDIEQADRSRSSRFDLNAELLRFFDCHVRGLANGQHETPPVRYYTMIESKWKSADSWPPKNIEQRKLFFGQHRQLVPAWPSKQCFLKYDHQPVSTGTRSRWNTQAQLNIAVKYPDRRQLRRQVSFRTEPLSQATELTGHTVAELWVASSITDPTVLIYLEDVHPSGKVLLVTEGGLSMKHRRVGEHASYTALGIPYHTFHRSDAASLVPIDSEDAIGPQNLVRLEIDLLPISYLFKRGHSLQISIALTDVDNFPASETGSIWLSVGGEFASRVRLPLT